MSSDEKYAVIRRNGLRWLADQLAVDRTELMQVVDAACVKDAVVIRRQDVFAPPALDAYANSISVAVQALRDHGITGPDVDNLTRIADYFHEQAKEAWDTERKLPS